MWIAKLEIVDEWSGYSPLAPLVARFRLVRREREFTGRARFSVGSIRPIVETRPIGLSLVEVDELWRRLRACARVPGPYDPTFTHTDDCPAISIRFLGRDGERVSYFTRSQGRAHVPWACREGGRLHVLRGDAPWRAYRTVRTTLGRDQLDRLARRFERERHC